MTEQRKLNSNVKTLRKSFFSVVLPVYNKGPYVARAIHSILKQTFENFELLIVCDPSTDNSNEEVAKFADPRIRVFHRDEPGPGGYAARNVGIRSAKADWVAFLDADDEWYPEHLQRIAKAISKHSEMEVFSAGWQHITGEGKVVKDPHYKKYGGKGSYVFTLNDYMHGPRPLWMGTSVVKKSLLIRVGGLDERWRHGADLQLWFKVLFHSSRPAYWVDYCSAVYYRDVPGQVTKALTQTRSATSEYIKYLISTKQIRNDKALIRIKRFNNKHCLNVFMRSIRGKSYNFALEEYHYIFFEEGISFLEKTIFRLYLALPIRTRDLSKRYFRKILSLSMRRF